jgi:hypothetical protein
MRKELMNLHADPVSEPDAYRRMLLAALGSDDPAEVQEATIGQLRELVESAGAALRERPAPGEWSAIECIGHIVDAELVVAGRSRWILAHDDPDLLPYDQDLWVSRLRHIDDDPNSLLALFEALRRADLDLWRRSTEEERARIGLHRERGPESYDLTFRLLAGHDRIHLAQARAALGSSSAVA